MTSSSTGRHRAGGATPPGTHLRPRHPHRGPVRRRPGVVRAVLVLAAAGLATGVAPVAAELVERARDTSRGSGVAGDGGAGAPSPDEVPSPESRPADEPEESTGSVEEIEPRTRPEDRRGSGRARGGERPPRDVPQTGPGTFRVAVETAPTEAAPELEISGELAYTVEIEDGLPFAPRSTAATVDRVLADPRGWETATGLELRRTGEDGDFRVLLASPETTDELCAPLQTLGEVSCRNGDLVVLNAERWASGVPDYDGHLRQYRTYLVNHEVGHRLGFGHVECTAPGSPAPVMQQQTYGLDGCTRNAWPDTA